jgi:glutathione S-transferase
MTRATNALEPGLTTLSGVPGSPYTRKMLAVLRYRRMPYRLLIRSHDTGDLPRPRVSMLPIFYLAGPTGEAEAVTDSTPLIRRFDAEIEARRVTPLDPALALVDALIEDYADEWLTKAMFHYRWAYEGDIAKAAAILPTWARGQLSRDDHARYGRDITERQVPRLSYVGSNPLTGPVIEAGYARFLEIFETHLERHAFILGARPGAGDFGVFGQLTQLAHFDPTPMALTLARAPRVFGWVGAVEDLSGLDPQEADWFALEDLPQTVHALLGEIGRVYAPLLMANAAAVGAGAPEFETQIDGQAWRQRTFPYQAKCVGWLRQDHQALDAAARARFDAVMAGTGCEPLFA